MGDCDIVSPIFYIQLGRRNGVPCIMVIRPKQVHDMRGGRSFRNAKGKGSMLLRCLEMVDPAEDPTATYRITVDPGPDVGEPSIPVNHNFSVRAVGPSSKEWDFSKYVNAETKAFVVVLEVLEGEAAA